MRRFTTDKECYSSLVNTLPITKNIKYSVVTEAHKDRTYAAYAPANLLQKANFGSNWSLSSERVGGTECSFELELELIQTQMTQKPMLRAEVGMRVCCELELELIQTQMTQKPMLRAEVGMRVRCANKASAE